MANDWQDVRKAYLGRVVATEELLEIGMTRLEIARWHRTGVVRRLRKGWYWLPKPELLPDEAFRAQVTATVRNARIGGRDLVLAGPAAAAWWDLPWVGRCPDHVTVCGSTESGRSARGIVKPVGNPPPGQITSHNGAHVTTVDRTVVDVARLSPSRTALAVADAALHNSMTNHDQLTSVAAGLTKWRGIARARAVIELADGRAESPGESVSRHCIARAGLPMPELQVEFTLPSGELARVDFLWREFGLIGEFDGLVKYRSADPQVLIAEKIREDGLRSLGYRVFRWTWKDIWRPDNWLTSLSAALTHPFSANRAHNGRSQTHRSAMTQ